MQLTDSKGRLHTITLAPGKQFHTHRGYLQHDELIGAPDGSTVTNTAGFQYLALRPLLSDYVMSMPRGAAIVYPKDAGHILTYADIQPGLRVVEAGVGSGALSLWLLRALAEQGVAVLPSSLEEPTMTRIRAAIEEAGLTVPTTGTARGGDRSGAMSEYRGYILAEMQSLARRHPGATW